ncbi:MAG: hypothetical protein JSU94_11435 [Phycisphaerales bacterium]|nr:MAG: hypothetical protein JSU94_11435 [Phycisphaerales bacterium]
MGLTENPNADFGLTVLTVTWPDRSSGHLNVVLFDNLDVRSLLRERPQSINRLLDQHRLPKWSDNMSITIYAVKGSPTARPGPGSLLVVSLHKAPKADISRSGPIRMARSRMW